MILTELCFSSRSSMVLVVRVRNAGKEDFCEYQWLAELPFERHEFSLRRFIALNRAQLRDTH